MILRFNFNPQGSHEPRQPSPRKNFVSSLFQSTRLSRASTPEDGVEAVNGNDFNPQGSHEPRLQNLQSAIADYTISIHKALTSLDYIERVENTTKTISIHKALTSLDNIPKHPQAATRDFNPQGSHEPRQQKYTIILASMPNLYILIIHLQQIIQQVKKFSRILILFSGRLQCESPWNFMCNYYSHQSFLTKNQPSFKLPPLSICAKFSRTILNNHLKWRSQLTVYPAVYYVLSRSKNSNVFT